MLQKQSAYVQAASARRGCQRHSKVPRAVSATIQKQRANAYVAILGSAQKRARKRGFARVASKEDPADIEMTLSGGRKQSLPDHARPIVKGARHL